VAGECNLAEKTERNMEKTPSTGGRGQGLRRGYRGPENTH